MEKIVFSISIILVFLNSGCDENSPNISPDTSSQIYPLSLNNSWVYKFETYDSLGNIDTTRIFTMVITRDTTINGEKWYSYTSQFIGFTNRSDGCYSYFEQPVMEYKYPAIVGDSIVVTPHLTRRVMATNKPIVVNGKDYTAYEYFDSYNTTSTQWTTYMVPNVGQVRVETTKLRSNSQRYLSSRTDLLSYTLY